jgi:hypothetical protein
MGAVAVLLVAPMAVVRDGAAPNGQRLAAKETAMEYVKFANDRLFAGADGGDVRADTCSIGYAYDGVEYVQDMIPLQLVSSKFASL